MISFYRREAVRNQDFTIAPHLLHIQFSCEVNWDDKESFN
jgi:hypothetical protein